MFFIFGWNHQKITSYDAVEHHECKNCHNTDVWQLKKISQYFTLFFVPIFPHDSAYWYHCPVCDYGIELEANDFRNYKSIAEINSAFKENSINEEEMRKKIEKIHNTIAENEELQRLKNIAESKNWNTLAVSKTTEELLQILNQKSSDYNPAFVISVKQELKNRKL